MSFTDLPLLDHEGVLVLAIPRPNININVAITEKGLGRKWGGAQVSLAFSDKLKQK